MRTLVIGLAVSVLVLGFAPVVAAAPNDGNGNKFVVDETFGPFPIGCDDVQVTVDFEAQFMVREHGKNVEVATFNIELMYENGAGDSWVFRDRGADRLYFEDGVMYQAVTGRSGIGNIGRLVFVNPFTVDEEIVFQKGQEIDPDAEACARLAS